MGKLHVLAVGAGKEQTHSIQCASSLGLEVVAVDGNPNAEGFVFASKPSHVDIRDTAAVLAKAKEYDIKAIIPSCLGRYITTIGYVNENMGLKGPGIFASDTCADKAAFFALMRKHSLPAPLQTKASEWVGGFPLIVKPRFGSGSKGVLQITNPQALAEYLNAYELGNSVGEALAEEIIDGTEYGIDAIIANRKIIFFNMREKALTDMPYRQEIRYISPAAVDSETHANTLDIITKTVRLLGIENSMLHADIILDKYKTPHIIDIAPRPAGLNIISKILKYNSGRDLITEWIKYQVWDEPIAPIEIKKNVCLQFLPYENATVACEVTAEELKTRHNDILDIEIYMKKGDTLGIIRNGNDLIQRGYFIIAGDGLKRRTNEILNEIGCTMIPNDEINKTNQDAWRKEIKRRVMLYPSERVVSFLARHFGDLEANRNKKALDIGFGSGRHLKLMLDYNFQTYGIDYVQECADIAKEQLGIDPHLKHLEVGEFSEYDFEKNGENNFNALVLWGMIFLKTKQEMVNDLKRCYSLLAPDGKIFLNFRTKEDTMFGMGREIATGSTYILDHPSYKNYVYTFLDSAEVEKLMDETGFKIISLEREDYWKNGLAEQHSWWIVTASKKA